MFTGNSSIINQIQDYLRSLQTIWKNILQRFEQLMLIVPSMVEVVDIFTVIIIVQNQLLIVYNSCIMQYPFIIQYNI